MTAWTLIREAFRTAKAQKVSSLVVALVVGAVCFAILASVGQAAANSRNIDQRLTEAGARVLTVTDLSGDHLINQALIDLVQSITGIETAVGLGTPVDVSNSRVPGGAKVPAWEVSNLDQVLQVSPMVTLQPGEAAATQSALDTLRFAYPSGAVESPRRGIIPLVAQGLLRPGFEQLDPGILVMATPDTEYNQLKILVGDISFVQPIKEAVLNTMGAKTLDQVDVEAPSGLALANTAFSSELAKYNRTLLLGILGVGIFLVSLISLTDVLLHRSDLGRRRALGITRVSLTILTTTQIVIPAAFGSCLGAGFALLYFGRLGLAAPLDFALAVIILSTGAALLAAIAPSCWAAFRDPVSVLRTP